MTNTDSNSGTVWFHKYPNGRFANAAFQVLFSRALEKNLGCRVALGDGGSLSAWAGAMFDLPDPQTVLGAIPQSESVVHMALGLDRVAGPQHDFDAVRDSFKGRPGAVLAVNGYFQYDTGFLRSDPGYRAAFAELLSLSAPPHTTFQRAMHDAVERIDRLTRDHYLITMHVRRGDFLEVGQRPGWMSEVFYTMDMDAAFQQLQNFLTANCIAKSILFVATDDPDYCRTYFAGRGVTIVTAEAVLGPGQHNTHEGLIIDLAAIASARLFIASNSSFSCLGSLMNDRARVFWRQIKGGQIVSFDPWATPVLFGLRRGI